MFDHLRIPLNQMLMRLAKVKQSQQQTWKSCLYYSRATVTGVTHTELTNHKTCFDLFSQEAKKLKFHCSILKIDLAEEKCWNVLFPLILLRDCLTLSG